MDRREFLSAGLMAMPLRFRVWPAAVAHEPLALVTADTEAHVALVSVASGRVRGRLATLEGPRSIQSGRGGVAVVAHTAVGAVSLLEVRPVRVGASCAGLWSRATRPSRPEGGGRTSRTRGRGELAVVDLERARVLRRVVVVAAARHVTLDPAGRNLWIGLGSSGVGDGRTRAADRGVLEWRCVASSGAGRRRGPAARVVRPGSRVRGEQRGPVGARALAAGRPASPVDEGAVRVLQRAARWRAGADPRRWCAGR